MGFKEALRKAVVSQFIRPRGFGGWLAGWEMALRPSNRTRNAWAVRLLEVGPTDRVLEIGFGPRYRYPRTQPAGDTRLRVRHRPLGGDGQTGAPQKCAGSQGRTGRPSPRIGGRAPPVR
jgi:hypothetical protein